MRNGTETLRGAALLHEADCDVFSLACEGNPEAFAEVYRRYRTRIYGFCLARLLSRELAEDATQETFVRFLSADTSTLESPRAWLFTVARNVCTDTWRRRQREDIADPLPDSSPIAGTSPDAAEEMRIAQDTRNGLLALRRMRPRYRSALILREIHGLPVSDIAESMGVSQGTAHTLISRARDSFARTYAEISGRPESCVDSMALIYRREGRTLSPAEQGRLNSHLEECPWCREQSRVTAGSKLTGLMPLLLASNGKIRGLMARIGLAINPIPEPLRDMGGVGPAVADLSSRVLVPLLVTASVALGTFGPTGAGDTLPPRIAELHHSATTSSVEASRPEQPAGTGDSQDTPVPTGQDGTAGSTASPVRTQSYVVSPHAADAPQGEASMQGPTGSTSGSGSTDAGTGSPSGPAATQDGPQASGSYGETAPQNQGGAPAGPGAAISDGPDEAPAGPGNGEPIPAGPSGQQ
jgi:RNA polymerase sigma-70 factor (ECF subfamily)